MKKEYVAPVAEFEDIEISKVLLGSSVDIVLPTIKVKGDDKPEP